MLSASPQPSAVVKLGCLAKPLIWILSGAARIAFAPALFICLALSATALGERSESFVDVDGEASIVEAGSSQDDADDQDDERWHLAISSASWRSRNLIALTTSSPHLAVSFPSSVSLHILFCCWLT